MSEKINYTIVYSKRRKKTLGLSINSKLEVKVTAPPHVSKKELDNFVESHSQWIITKIGKIEKSTYETRNKRYITGETVLFMGRLHTLRVEQGSAEAVKIENNEIIVKNPRVNNQFSTKTILTLWLKTQAKKHIETRTLQLFNDFNVYGLKAPKIGFRKMKSKWGECRSDGIINFNYLLIKTPEKCIDYVIIHELCHLVEANHSKKFYSLLDTHMPGWKKHKKELDKLSLGLTE